MIFFDSILNTIKYYFILNRAKLADLGIYQIFYFIYRTYYYILSKYYGLGQRNVLCPVCGFAGNKYVRNKVCPKCWSSARHRLLALKIMHELKYTPNSRILEIAPNIATSYIFDRKFYPNYVSIDLNSPIAEMHMDLTNLGIKNNSIDFIICYHVLEHIKDDTRAIHELYRVLKSGATAIIQVPFSATGGCTFESDEHASTDRAMNLKLYGHPDHVRRYGEEDFLNKLRSSGFYVLIDNFASTFTELELEKFGIDKHEKLFVCNKGYELT